MTTAEKLNTVYDAFNGIKDAIIEKGGTAGSSITEYPQNILDLPSGGDANDVLFRRCTEYKMPDGERTIPYGFQYGNNKLVSFDGNNATSVGSYAFWSCAALSSVSFPAATSIGSNAFYGCSSLAAVPLPVTTSIGTLAFYGCSSLTSIELPSATSIGNNVFQASPSLVAVSLPAATSIGSGVFQSCYKLKVINFGNTLTKVPTLSNTNAFTNVGNNGSASALGSYHIVVPDALYDEWITKTNWSSTTNYIKQNTIKYSDALAQGIITE